MSGKRNPRKSKPPVPPRDPMQPFSDEEKQAIKLAAIDVVEYRAGYVHIERLRLPIKHAPTGEAVEPAVTVYRREVRA